MIGLLLLFFIARAYSELAFDYDKSRWGYGILGLIMYYIGTFIGGLIIGITGLILGVDLSADRYNIVLTLLGVPFGVLTCWGCYKILGNYWENKSIIQNKHFSDGDQVL